MSNELIKKINKNIVHEDGTIDSFESQLLDLLSGEFDLTKPLVLNSNSKAINYVDKVNTEYPLVMNVSTFIKLQNIHSLSLNEIKRTEEYLKDSVLAVGSMTENESVVVIIDKINHVTQEPYIISCRYDKRVGITQVNEITSMYDRNRFNNFLINTYNNDRVFYKNEKTEQYFKVLNRLQLPQELKYALSNNYDKQSFTKSQVEQDIKSIENEINDVSYTDAFFISKEQEFVDWVYYNPDSNNGGQYVINRFDFDLIREAVRDWKIADEFFDFIGSCSKQTLIDIGDTEFMATHRMFLDANGEYTSVGNESNLEEMRNNLILNTIGGIEMANSKSKEFRKEIADSFVAGLETKGLEWKQGWSNLGLMHNAKTGKPYRGINQLRLQLISAKNGYEDPRWMTFKQIQGADGLKLQKGSKGTTIEYWFPYDEVDGKAVTYKERKELILNGERKIDDFTIFPKYFYVFNGSCIEGLPELERNLDVEPSEIINKLSTNMNVPILNDGGNRAFYRPDLDSIHLPKPEYFKNSESYNATALHELAHATGHEARLNRTYGVFGDPEYAREELVAEITSAFMMAETGISIEDMDINNHQAYINNWIEIIKDEPEALFTALKEAENSANYMGIYLEDDLEADTEKHISKNKTIDDEMEL